MKARALCGIVAVLAVLSFTSVSPAPPLIIAAWDFEPQGVDVNNVTSYPNPIPGNGGGYNDASSNAGGTHASAATDWSFPVGNGSSDAFSSNTWAAGDYYQFSTNASGVTGVRFEWCQTRSGTGPTTFDLAVSTDGGANFATVVNDQIIPATTWQGGVSDPGTCYGPFTVPAADNQANAMFRLVAQVAGSAAAGTSRVDNVFITPEPSALALLGVGALALIRRRR